MRAAMCFGWAGVLLFVALASAQSRPAAPARPLPAGNVEHGRYIAERVAMCVECHSGRDGMGNILESQRYLGAELPYTPAAWARNGNWATRAPRTKGLAGYDDAQALRLLTEGSIGRNGVQLRPPMPRFHMTPQDAADVIAFLRSVP